MLRVSHDDINTYKAYKDIYDSICSDIRLLTVNGFLYCVYLLCSLEL